VWANVREKGFDTENAEDEHRVHRDKKEKRAGLKDRRYI
jgi:hypothetical protein